MASEYDICISAFGISKAYVNEEAWPKCWWEGLKSKGVQRASGLKRSINKSTQFPIGLTVRNQQTVQQKYVSPEQHSEGALDVTALDQQSAAEFPQVLTGSHHKLDLDKQLIL
ncbi:hypothetical protein UPYG_G00259710 [Umbra pygmaea]|uniref:Uncharacterized protein n=1 Tax=Umbra pygmaea TaxID=75934 RepID=A0ABD0W972_UMBPY